MEDATKEIDTYIEEGWQVPSKKEVVLDGVEAMQAIQCFTVLQMLNDVLGPAVEKILAEGYTEEVAKQMKMEVFSGLVVASQVQEMSAQLLAEFTKLTGITGEAFAIDVETMPVIKVKTINESEEK